MKKKISGYERLELFELQTIFLMRASGRGVREIARILKRGAGTVSNAFNKHRHPNGWTWLQMTALERAKYVYDEMTKNRWRARLKGHIRDPLVRAYVIRHLVDDQWSPEQIENSIGEDHPGKKITAKTIYTFIKRDRSDLKAYLRERGKARRQRVADRRGRFKQGAPTKRSIHDRPSQIDERKEVGHWEGDTIVTKKKGKKAILSLRERVTRKRIYRLIADLKAETVLAALWAILEELPPKMRKSITFDNGSEFAYSDLIALENRYEGLKLYFCDSYASWQKGSVENSNKDLRWYHPKGTDFGLLSPYDVRHLEEKINNRPMKCNGYRSANEAFAAAA